MALRGTLPSRAALRDPSRPAPTRVHLLFQIRDGMAVYTRPDGRCGSFAPDRHGRFCPGSGRRVLPSPEHVHAWAMAEYGDGWHERVRLAEHLHGEETPPAGPKAAPGLPRASRVASAAERGTWDAWVRRARAGGRPWPRPAREERGREDTIVEAAQPDWSSGMGRSRYLDTSHYDATAEDILPVTAQEYAQD